MAQNTLKNPWLAAEAEQAGGTTAGPATGGSAIQKQQPGKAEHKLYFYHPDHLGSTGYVTDETGSVYQQLQYFPFGETGTEEASNTDRIPYLFTGKELDEETGLYYFGARYYDPRASLWVSVDPPLSTGEYLPEYPYDEYPFNYDPTQEVKGYGGVFNTKNLGGFSYVGQNPVIYSDPTGRIMFNIAGATIGAGVGGVSGALIAASQGKDLKPAIKQGALIGAISGATLGLVAAAVPAELAVSSTILAGGVLGGATEIVQSKVTGEKVDQKKVAQAIVTGMGTAGVGSASAAALRGSSTSKLAASTGGDISAMPISVATGALSKPANQGQATTSKGCEMACMGKGKTFFQEVSEMF